MKLVKKCILNFQKLKKFFIFSSSISKTFFTTLSKPVHSSGSSQSTQIFIYPRSALINCECIPSSSHRQSADVGVWSWTRS